MKDFLHLPPCADVLVDGCIEVFGLVHPRAGTDKARLNIVLQEHLKRLPMLLIDSEHEKRHHALRTLNVNDDDGAFQRARSEAENSAIPELGRYGIYMTEEDIRHPA